MRHLQNPNQPTGKDNARRMAIVRRGAKVMTGLVAAVIGFVCPTAVIKSDAAGQREEASGPTGFRIPSLLNSAHASMHVNTIANLTTVLRFKANIMSKSSAEIRAFVHKLFHEAAAAKNSNDAKALLRSTKRLMVLTEALRDRAEALEKARK